MRSTNTLLQLRLVAFIALALAADAQATNYYVSPSGDDGNAGTSAATAFRTIKKAAEIIQSGDTVFVAPGTYTDKIVVNGVQGSSTPAVFFGSSGATVTAQWKVVNSNYVQIQGFTFEDGGADRLLVWKGSYEGLIEDCQFTDGDEGLLIKDGSLTIDDCQIQNFTHDGIQVDGEADVLLRDSTISGCQEAGIEIRKVARVEFDNCNVDSNLGDGIEVNITTDSIDTGTEGGKWNGLVPLAGADGPVSMGGNSQVDGDLSKLPAYTVDPSRVSGSIHDLPPTMTFPPIDPGDAATNNDNAGIPQTDKNKDPLNAADEFHLNSNDGIDLPPGTYYFTKLDCKPNSDLRISGPTVVYVAGNVVLKGDVNAGGLPSNLHIYVAGTLVDITSQADVKAGIYAPDATIKMRGGSEVEGMLLAGSLDMAGNSGITTHSSLVTLVESLFPAPPTSPSPPASWQPVASGELEISGGSAFMNNGNGVRIVTQQEFTTRDTDFSNNTGWGLSLFGVSQVENCTLNNNSIGGVRLQSINTTDLTVLNLTLANNTQYGVYAADCGLTFDGTNIDDWDISGSPIAITGQASDLVFGIVTVSGGTTAAVQVVQGTLTATGTTFSGSGHGLDINNSTVTLTNCTLSRNTVGLYANQNPSLTVTDTTITGNSQWGAAVYGGGTAGPATFDNCTIHTNVGGLTVVNGGNGELLLRGGTVIRDNTNAGLHFDNCTMTVNDQVTHGWQITDNLYGISSNNSTLVLDGITVSGGTYGLWAIDNVALTVDSSTFSGSSAYGVYLQGTGSLHDCTITGNANGLYLNSTNVTDVNLTGTDISGNTTYGVYAYNGSLSLSAQSTEGWSIDSNGYNIYGDQAAILLTGATLTNATSYGVYAEYGSVNLLQSTITSNLNGVSSSNATAFTIDRCHISGASTGSWAVVNVDGGLTMRNTVMSGAQSGVYSSETLGTATIYNSTIAGATLYGIHAYSGDSVVMNTIISGTNGTYGLYLEPSASVTHTHNLIHGFTTPFYNTTAASTEIQKPPRFTDAAGGDYSLGKGSPAINAGVDLTSSHTDDMLGNSRPSHQVFEIGAYEYMQNAGSFRVLDWQEQN